MRSAVVLVLLLGASVVWGQDVVPDPCADGPALYRDAQFSEARAALRQCLDANGPSVEILLPLVVMGVREGRLDEAVADGAAAVAVAPDDVEAHYWYGRALLRSHHPAEAKAEWELGLGLSMDHLGILEGLSRLAMAENEPAKAYQLLGRLQIVGSEQPWAQRLMADIAAGKGLWKESLGHLEAAMALDGGGTAGDLMTAAELSIMTGNKTQGVDYGRRAVALEPGPATYGGLGQAYLTADLVDSAIVYLRRAVEGDAEAPIFRFNLANALEIDGQVAAADVHFREFIRQVPDDAVGQFNFAVHLQQMGHDAEALAAAEKALTLDSSMMTARVVRAQVLEEMGRWDGALAELMVLKSRDTANMAQLNMWETRLRNSQEQALKNADSGKIHLLDLVVGTQEQLDAVQAALTSGSAYTALVVRYSLGSTAAKGGDIGWVAPADMLAGMGTKLADLEINEISPPIESKGLFHIFKRVP